MTVPKVVMKTDIEGSEWMVFPDLIRTRSVCGVDFIFCEFHPLSKHYNKGRIMYEYLTKDWD